MGVFLWTVDGGVLGVGKSAEDARAVGMHVLRDSAQLVIDVVPGARALFDVEAAARRAITIEYQPVAISPLTNTEAVARIDPDRMLLVALGDPVPPPSVDQAVAQPMIPIRIVTEEELAAHLGAVETGAIPDAAAVAAASSVAPPAPSTVASLPLATIDAPSVSIDAPSVSIPFSAPSSAGDAASGVIIDTQSVTAPVSAQQSEQAPSETPSIRPPRSRKKTQAEVEAPLENGVEKGVES